MIGVCWEFRGGREVHENDDGGLGTVAVGAAALPRGQFGRRFVGSPTSNSPRTDATQPSR